MTPDRVEAVAVVVPARDEAEHLASCLASVRAAARACRVPVAVVVVLDCCQDDSAHVAREAMRSHTGPWCVVDAVARCVADVRDDGIEAALELLALPEHAVWVANTDADTYVGTDWLERHRGFADAGADLVAGFAVLDDDPSLSAVARLGYAAHMASQARTDGTHVHVYGANLGVRASTWRGAGGFPRVPVGEDTALVDAVTRAGARVVRPVQPTVVTSARRRGRAGGGLADLLDSFEEAAVSVDEAAGAAHREGAA